MDEEPAVRRQQRGEESRKALLEAGVELLREETQRGLEQVISAREVSRRTHRSTGSFFHYWPSTAAYIDDLIEHIFGSGLLPENVDEVVDHINALIADPRNAITALEAICRLNFTHVAEEANLSLELLLRSHLNDERITAGLRSFYRRNDEHFRDHYAALGSVLGREPRPPFDYTTIVVVLTAVLEGLVLRHLVDDERVPNERFGEIVLALLPMLSRAVGDAEDLKGVVAGSLVDAPTHATGKPRPS